jgi:sugar phosphate permease
MTHPSESATPTRVRYLVLGVACSLAVLTYIQRQGFVASLPYIKESLKLDDEQLGYMGALWLVAYGAFQMPAGMLGDRFGARHLLTFLVLGWSLTLAVTGFIAFLSPGGWLPFACLVALQFLFGIFQAGGFPVLARVIADWMPARQRGFAQGTVWTFSRLGGAVAPQLMVWLILVVFAGWAIPLWLLGGLGLLWCAFFWLWFRNRPGEMPAVNAAERDFIASGQSAPAAAVAPL